MVKLMEQLNDEFYRGYKILFVKKIIGKNIQIVHGHVQNLSGIEFNAYTKEETFEKIKQLIDNHERQQISPMKQSEIEEEFTNMHKRGLIKNRDDIIQYVDNIDDWKNRGVRSVLINRLSQLKMKLER